ncbi:MAG: redoxin domain-containing protein [Acidobacteriota bacterium]|nr:redoxin domain-containing protein [Acidobacteriota bacterium]
MRFLLAALLLCQLSGSSFAGDRNFILEGTVSLTDGPVTAAYLQITPAWQLENRQTRNVAVGPDGRFSLELPARDEYLVVVGHPGYESLVTPMRAHRPLTASVAVTLDRPAEPKAVMVFPVNSLDMWQKPTPMTSEGDTFTVTLESNEDAVRYVLLANYTGCESQGEADGFDPRGNRIYKVPVKDGKARIVHKTTPFTYRDAATSRTGLKATGDAVYPFFGTLSRPIYETFQESIRAKMEKHDRTPGGLEPMFQQYKQLLADIADERDRMLATMTVHRTVSFFTRAFDQTEALRAELDKDPAFWSQISDGIAISLNLAVQRDPEFSKLPQAERMKRLLDLNKEYLTRDVGPSDKIAMMRFIGSFQEEDKTVWLRRIIETWPNSHDAANVRKELAQEAMVGKYAPQIALNDPSGKPVKLTDYAGKYVLLDFWTSTCGPCIAAMPGLNKIWNKVDRDQVVFISICLDKEGKELAALNRRYKMTWPQMGATGGFNADVAKAWSVAYVPNLFLIDPTGKIIIQNDGLGNHALERTLAKYLKPAAKGDKSD